MKVRKHDIPALEIMLLDRHMRVSEVAAKVGVTRQRIWQICKEHGIQIHRPIIKICMNCDNEFTTTRSVARYAAHYCSKLCYFSHKADISDYQPSKQGQRAGRRVIEKWLGEPLPAGCIVHHEDGNCMNNKLWNLYVFRSHADHIMYHHAKRHGNAVLPYARIHDLPHYLSP